VSTADLAPPERALAVGAHPDDVEFGCGATLAKWSAAGTHVELLVLTDGAKGTWDAGADTRALVETRRAEQHDAARVLGIDRVHFLDEVDGVHVDPARTRELVCAVIRGARPDVVLGHDPWKQYRLHPDHRHAGTLTIDAIVAARDPHFFPDAGAPHRPRHLLLFEAQVVDHAESVDGYVDAKIGALLCHRSQWRSTMDIDPAGDDDDPSAAFAARIRAELATPALVGAPPLCEAFKRLDDL
jgi:LmbE family N-acetylglucosaminyl deacetylase